MIPPHTYRTVKAPFIAIEQERYDGWPLLKYARFCDEACRDGWMEDRKHGVIYPPFEIEFDSGNVAQIGWYDAMRWFRECPYCRADVPHHKEIEAQTLHDGDLAILLCTHGTREDVIMRGSVVQIVTAPGQTESSYPPGCTAVHFTCLAVPGRWMATRANLCRFTYDGNTDEGLALAALFQEEKPNVDTDVHNA